MEETGVKQRLAVMLAAEDEGCSRLMGAVKRRRTRTLRAYPKIIDNLTARHEGRSFGAAADSAPEIGGAQPP